jgi:HEPN domain-containing protein
MPIIFNNYNLEIDISNYIVDTSYSKLFNDLSLSLVKYNENSDFLINLNLDYLVSYYPDTYLKIEIFYDYSNNETKIGESILGTANLNLLKNSYNFTKIVNVDISSGSIINFYTKLSYLNENNVDLSDNYKPQILLDKLGNNICVIEINKTLHKNNNLGIDINNYIVDSSYGKVFDDLSLSLVKYNGNSDFLINLNLEYSVSYYPDTYLKIETYYDFSNNETKIAESILGTGNTTLLKNNYNFNKIVNVDISAANIVNFYTKLSYINEYNVDLSDNYKPQIILDKLGNNISVIEIDKTIHKNNNLVNDISNYLVDTSYGKIFNDLSLSLVKYNDNSDFLINLNLDYLVSYYPDTYLKIETFYDYSNNETKIAESILGTGNTNLLKNNYNFSKIINVDIPSYSLVIFYTKLSYVNENNLDLSDNYKPQIILDNCGNNMFVIEV